VNEADYRPVRFTGTIDKLTFKQRYERLEPQRTIPLSGRAAVNISDHRHLTGIACGCERAARGYATALPRSVTTRVA
jgi:hypothetical protein